MPQLPFQIDVQTGLWAVGGLVVLLLILRAVARRREDAAYRRRRAELSRTYDNVQMSREQIARLSARVIATSSTGEIVGFEVLRQIETVFTDGHPAPARAAEALKAQAAERGANAIINLAGVRQPNGRYAASGDAVIVRLTASGPEKPAGA
ncbi:MAG: hypothetical protein IPM64_10220 [Phycisphaerales bacterium]|nr:hypothetical protein [Phycisphaerales bacterium]